MEKSNSTKWVIHWFLIDRNELEFTDIEKFHLKVFEKYKPFILSNIDKIIVSFAKTSNTNPSLIQYIEKSLELLFNGKEIVFQVRENNQKVGEFETFRDNVLANIGSNEKILYTHIKGAYRTKAVPKILKKELLWIWNMYRVVFNKQLINSIDDFIMSGPDFSIYDESFHSIKIGTWNPHLHILRTYLLPLKDKLSSLDNSEAMRKYVKNLDEFKHKKPWAYLGTFYWINMGKLGNYLEENGFLKNDILEITSEFQKYDRPLNMPSAITSLNGNKVIMSFANNVSEYFLPSIVDISKCSFFKLPK